MTPKTPRFLLCTSAAPTVLPTNMIAFDIENPIASTGNVTITNTFGETYTLVPGESKNLNNDTGVETCTITCAAGSTAKIIYFL